MTPFSNSNNRNLSVTKPSNYFKVQLEDSDDADLDGIAVLSTN